MTKDPEAELKALEGAKIGRDLTLHLTACSALKGREKEIRYFQAVINELPSIPVITGLFSAGRETIGVKPYFDIDFNYLIPNHIDSLDLSREGRDLELFAKLSMLVEGGGKMIVALATRYEGPLIRESFRAVDLGYPPEVSYIGSLLYHSGCGDYFKLWLIREGGLEGPPALQGEKALDENQIISCEQEKRKNLNRFLTNHGSEEDELSKACKMRANYILRIITDRQNNRKIR